MMAVLITIAVLHHMALFKFYYWNYGWFDVLMHFLGGLWVALFFLWFVGWFNLPIKISVKTLVVFLVVIAFLWEAWELFYGLTNSAKEGYVVDTSVDILMGLLGTLSVSLLYKEDLKNG